ncbi:MAG TPA: O-antigen ligase family protein [Phototrophicaceae bacterium]|nr:O-antigen ligase family protein [Phototrophicaceae bacterium]
MRVLRWLTYLEPIWLLVMLVTFWQFSPERDAWLPLLYLTPLFWGARWLSYRRLGSFTPLTFWLLALVGLMALNVYTAPFTWYNRTVNGLFILGRPLLGMLLIFYFIEYARNYKKTNLLLTATTILGLLLGIIALVATQWNNKSDQLGVILDLLPVMLNLPGMKGGFNANEIAGALIYLLPVLAALAVYRWRLKLPRMGVSIAFILVFAALFLGQSRLAIIGMLAALGLVAWLVAPAGRWRSLALLVVILVGIFQVLIMNNVFDLGRRSSMRARDEISYSNRTGMWRSALAIIQDYPLTGVGMNMYRAAPVRQLYPVKNYETRVLPHAHNEWLQLGADLGVPGLIGFAGLYLITAYMLLVSYQRGSDDMKALAVGVFAGLIAHGVFGMGDAIPWWDRFSFVFWWLLALAGAAYIHTKNRDRLTR